MTSSISQHTADHAAITCLLCAKTAVAWSEMLWALALIQEDENAPQLA